MENTKTEREVAAEWADFVIMIWIEQMSKLGVNNARIYAESFQQMVYSNANGNVERVTFTFDYFLRFTDMGVGKGTNMSQSMTGQTNRTRKMWYSKTFLREVRILVDIIAQQYNRQAQVAILSNLEKTNSHGK